MFRVKFIGIVMSLLTYYDDLFFKYLPLFQKCGKILYWRYYIAEECLTVNVPRAENIRREKILPRIQVQCVVLCSFFFE